MTNLFALPLLLRVLVVDNDSNTRRSLALCLETEGHRVTAVSNVADALQEATRQASDLAFVNVAPNSKENLSLIPALHRQCPWLRIVVLAAHSTVDTAVESMKMGAADYLPKPFTAAQVKYMTHKFAELRALELKVAGLQQAIGDAPPDGDIAITNSPAMQRVIHMAHQVAKTDASVLIRGESGTGKGVLTRVIHSWSLRADKTLGTVSCPSLSAELLESELFGHVKGAFTGAIRNNPGRIAMCDGGTLFLDEIGDLPIGIQPKLLRFLQDREYERVGESITRRADIRLISATNAKMEESVTKGTFREDLLYRLNVIQLEMPALRERQDDIVPLANRMLMFFNHQNHKTILGFQPEVAEALRTYRWPGNIRELRNVIERCAILCASDYIGTEHLPPTLSSRASVPTIGALVSLEQLEEAHIRHVLGCTRSLEEAAGILGIDVATLWRRRKKYGV